MTSARKPSRGFQVQSSSSPEQTASASSPSAVFFVVIFSGCLPPERRHLTYSPDYTVPSVGQATNLLFDMTGCCRFPVPPRVIFPREKASNG